ncbi:MAG: ferredoxin [Candidatus Woesearchaeota archaeon]|jgi:ferredoxin
MPYKITVDQDACIGCGACEATAPDFFKMNADGKAKPVKDTVDKLGNANEGKSACPVDAIKIEEKK